MAGVAAMGELSHELESLVTRIESGTASADERARQVAQEAIDELSRMREATAGGRLAESAPALIARIRFMASGAVAAPGSESAAPLASQVQAPAAVAAQVPPAASAAATRHARGWRSCRRRYRRYRAPVWTRGWRPKSPRYPFAVAPAPELPVALPALLPPGREPVVAADRTEMARVSAELLDQLLNNAGEVSIARARLEQQLGAIEFNLGELSRTVTRLKEQLRKLEIETEAQILHRHDSETGHRAQFDPLELDRYSSIQQFSRALAESANDVASIQSLLENLIGEAQNLLQQQSRTVTELQNGLMRTRMVSFQRHVQRLARIVRQAATDTGKRAELVVDGASGEFDRQVLERMLPPFEHMLQA